MDYTTQLGGLKASARLQDSAQYQGIQYASDAAAPARDNTDLEVIRDSMKERIKHGEEINARLSSLVIKLLGCLPPSSGREGGPAAVPNGLIADLHDIAGTLGAVQSTTIDLIGRLTSAV